MATTVESTTAPRSSLPNVYTGVTAREIDFVTRFNDNWDTLRNILGIMRPIRKAPGSADLLHRRCDAGKRHCARRCCYPLQQGYHYAGQQG